MPQRLGQLQRIVHLHTQVANGALKLWVSEEQLAGAQIATLLLKQRHLGALGLWVP